MIHKSVLPFLLLTWPSVSMGLEVDSGEVALPSTTTAVSELWETISFGTTFSSVPVVIASPGPSTGGQPFTIRIQNVTTSGFEAQIVEAEGTSGPTHYAVDMTYIAMEQGIHGLPDGSVIVAGTHPTTTQQFASNHSLISAWDSVGFGVSFSSSPTILTQVQTTVNETGAVPIEYSTPFLTVAVDNVSLTGFDVALDRSEAVPGSVLLDEDIGWIAITSNTNGYLTDISGNQVLWESLRISASSGSIGKNDGCTTESLTAPFISTVPAVVSMNSRNEDDGGWAIVCSLSSTSLGYAIDEDWYLDNERSHIGEDIGVLLFESGVIDLDLDADDDGIDDTVENGLGTDDENPDSDGDGWCDGDIDVAPTCFAGEGSGIDTDGDGLIDALDVDSDNDGILDSDEDFTTDVDGDGIPTIQDPDDDGDTIIDGVDACPGFDDLLDSDGDGTADGCDLCPFDPLNDIDGDGICADIDFCPIDNPDDTDGDTVCDSEDICPGFDDNLDGDGDGQPDDCDNCPLDEFDDSDSDGVCDSDDACQGFDDSIDADGDGQPWGCDPCPIDNPDDTDGDEICDSNDDCVYDPENDVDGDGFCADQDNCPEDFNEDQSDVDEDGIGDECDPVDDRPTDDTGVVEDSGELEPEPEPEEPEVPRNLAGGWDCSGCATSSGTPRSPLFLFPLLCFAFVRRSEKTRPRTIVGILIVSAPFLMGSEGQTYRIPLGDSYTLMDSPMRSELTSFRSVGGYAWAPLVLRAEESGYADDTLVEHLIHGDVRYQRKFGSSKAGLVLGGDVPIQYAKNYAEGLSNPRLSVGFTGHNDWVGGVMRGSVVVPTTGNSVGAEAEATVGVFRPTWGVSVAGGGIYRPEEPALQAKAGFYVGPEKTRFSSEWVGQFGKHSPSEVVLGGQFKKGWMVVSPALGVGINGEAGTPRLRGLLSLSIQQPPPKKIEPLEPVVAPEPLIISMPDSVFANLNQVAKALSGSQLHIRVEVHVKEDWGLKTEERIEAMEKMVTEYLVSQGVAENRISVEAKGVTGSDWIDIVVVEKS